jgi:hypothetical protein
MPSLAALTPLGLKMIASRPGWSADDPDMRAVAHVEAKEIERMQERAEEVRDGMIPHRSNLLVLPLWETLLKLTINPAGTSENQRREIVEAGLRRAVADPSGLTWEERVTELIGPSWAYQEEPEQTIKVTVPWKPGSSQFIFAQRVLERERPAAWELTVEFEEGFVLDLSKLDAEQFHNE